MEHPPCFPPVMAHQIDQNKNNSHYEDECIRGDIQELLKSEYLTEESKTVEAALKYMTLADPSPQSKETQLPLHEAFSGK